MSAIGYGSSFVKTTNSKKEVGIIKNPMEAILDKVNDDLDTLVSTNYQHK
jgi:hypothetical protein